ncbi:MAG: PKD domain-containing protein [Candidatus Aminicenantales bacterium]|jgi:surface-anchored protein
MNQKKLFLFLVIALLVVLTATSFAETKKLKRIGLYTFVQVKGQVPTPEVMKMLFDRYADDIRSGFEQAGYAELYQPFMDQLKTAEFKDEPIAVGDKLMWMLFKSQGKVKVAEDIEWAGKSPLPAFSVQVKKDWKIYDFVIPKPCGNIALRSITQAIPPATCSLVVVPERANINDPITIDMSGTQNAKSMTVEVYDAQGQKIATQALTPDSPKWQTKFDKPGEYSFRGAAVNMEGIAATNPCVGKTYINIPPICKLWTSCLPCEDYVGRPITFDASGSTDPDGQVVKVVFELLDSSGKVIDTCVTTRKPFVWEKVFTKAGTYTISATAYDNDGAKSASTDQNRLTFEVTQKKFFWQAAVGPMLSAGYKSDLSGSTYVLGAFLRGGMFYWVDPDKWSFTLTAGGAMPFKGSPWDFAFLAEALINGHYKKSYAGIGLGLSTKSQSLTTTGADIVAQVGTNVFQTWTKFGSLFLEFRAPVGRSFKYNNRFGLGFRMLF